MDNAITIKNWTCAAIGVIGGWISHLVGGCDLPLWVLLIFMGLDYFTGLMVAGVFHKSIKSQKGGIDSRIALKGLCRKLSMFVVVIVGNLTDMIAGTTYIRDAVVIFLCSNEAISILENAGMMGAPMPKFLLDALDQLHDKVDGGNMK